MRTTVVLAVVSLLSLSGCTEQSRSARTAPARSALQTEEGPAWSIQIVDTSGITGLDISTSIALDSDGRPRTSYGDPAQGPLKYATWNGSSRDSQTIDSSNSVSEGTSLILDEKDQPHICYSGIETSGGQITGPGPMKITRGEGFVNYAVWNDSSWVIETAGLRGSLGRPSLALDSHGQPHVTCGGVVLKYATRRGSSWDAETVDSAPAGSLGGGFTSLVIDSTGHPHIGYFDPTNGDLKYGTWKDSS